MSTEEKGQASSSDSEVASQVASSHDVQSQSHGRSTGAIDGVRVGLTGLALLCGLSILGTSGDALATYDTTHVSGEFQLHLWPEEFDLRPTVALAVGSAIIVVVNIISLAFSKVKMLRNRTAVHTPITFIAPFLGFTAAMMSMTWFYAINASSTVDTLQSWSCQWESVGMAQKPHFGTVCKESKTALYLSIILVPVEAAILSIAAVQFVLERKANRAGDARKHGSPALS